jgi:hypothetical protein
MNTLPPEQDWEKRLRSGLGSAPAPDFQAWRERHPEAVAALAPAVRPVSSSGARKHLNRRTVVTTLKFIAASLIAAGGLAWLGLGDGTLSPSAFADEIPGVDGVQTMTWTDTYYLRLSSEDGKRTWIEKERRLHAYRHPGQHRETMLDRKGEVIGVHITDTRAGRMLALDMRGKKAVLKAPVIQYGERPPFAYVGDIIRERKTGSESSRIKSISLQGQRQVDKVEANVVQAIIESTENKDRLRHDFLFDAASKQLVGIWGSSEPDFDYEAASELENPADEQWHKMQPIGVLSHEVVVNPKLDASEFSLDPPANFAFEKIAAPTVTEDEMIAYLKAAARFNDNQFPDSPYNAYDSDKLNEVWEKAESDPAHEANELIGLINKFRFREIYQSPVKQFEADQAAPDSFVYVGSGLKVGQADRIVCWYRSRSGATYRAVYGDLSVKEVTAAELPLTAAN